MLGDLFRVVARPGKLQELVDFLTWDGQVSRTQEPGTLRFEFYPDPADAQALFVYEAYVDEAAFQVHASHEPYKRWNSGLKDELTSRLDVIFSGTAQFWMGQGDETRSAR